MLKRYKKALVISTISFVSILSLIAIVLCPIWRRNNETSFASRKQYWCIEENYKFDDYNKVISEWIIVESRQSADSRKSTTQPQFVINSRETAFIRNGNLVIRTFRRNGTYHTPMMLSVQSYSPSNHEGSFSSIEPPSLYKFGKVDLQKWLKI